MRFLYSLLLCTLLSCLAFKGTFADVPGAKKNLNAINASLRNVIGQLNALSIQPVSPQAAMVLLLFLSYHAYSVQPLIQRLQTSLSILTSNLSVARVLSSPAVRHVFFRAHRSKLIRVLPGLWYH
jgi:hypothetical protein